MGLKLIIASGIGYGESPLKYNERALVFSDHTKEQMEEVYSSFLKEKNHKKGEYKIFHFNDILPPDFYINKIKPFDTYYKSSAVFAIYFFWSGRPTIEQKMNIRNKHLDDFVRYLVKHEIPVAERLPMKFTEQEQKEYDNRMEESRLREREHYH